KAIKEEFGVRQPEQIRTLAKKSPAEWAAMVDRKHAAGELNLPVQVDNFADQSLPQTTLFGNMLERQFREAYPTTAFAGGLERALRNGGSKGLNKPKDVSTFLDENQNFEFLTTPVDEFLNKKVAGGTSAALAKDDAFRLQLKAVQRVFKLVPNFDAADTL